MESDVWYVAYGSNLSSVRLQRYLDRGADPSVPRDARAGVTPHRLFFAHESSTWSGGTAFIDPTVDGAAETRTVAWRLAADQFLHVLASENARATLDVSVDDLPVAVGEALSIVPSRYGLVVRVESPDARPAFTFTTGEVPLPAPTRPARDYVDTIVAGLIEHHGLDDMAARSYLAERGA